MTDIQYVSELIRLAQSLWEVHPGDFYSSHKGAATQARVAVFSLAISEGISQPDILQAMGWKGIREGYDRITVLKRHDNLQRRDYYYTEKCDALNVSCPRLIAA